MLFAPTSTPQIPSEDAALPSPYETATFAFG